MPIIARQTITYLPPTGPELVLCRAGSDVLDTELSLEATATIQRDQIIGRPWILQRSVGNAALSLSLAVSRVYPSAARAEAAGEDIRQALALNPVGTLRIASCFESGTPQRVVDYTAGVDRVLVTSLTSDRWYGQGFAPNTPSDQAVQDLINNTPGQAWITINYELTLTDPTQQ